MNECYEVYKALEILASTCADVVWLDEGSYLKMAQFMMDRNDGDFEHVVLMPENLTAFRHRSGMLVRCVTVEVKR